MKDKIKDILNEFQLSWYLKQVFFVPNNLLAGYYFLNSGAAPARKLRDRSLNRNHGRDLNSYEVINDEVEEDNINDSELDDDLDETIETEENSAQDNFNETASSTKPEVKTQAKNKIIKALLKSPWFYFTIAGIASILFIVGMIISMIPRKFPPTIPKLLCSGPSKIDNYIVITTNESGVPEKIWSYYDYIASITYRELGLLNPEDSKIPHQLFAIVASSSILGEQYNEETLKNNYQKYAQWCPKNADGKYDINNQYGLDCYDFDPKINLLFIVEDSKNTQKTCDVRSGCLGWANEGYFENFGIEDGSCLLEFQEENQTEPKVKNAYCEIKKENYNEEGYTVITEGGVKKVLVELGTEAKIVRHNDSLLQHLMQAIDDTRGVLMVSREGVPQKTEYKNKYNLDSPACMGNVRDENQPILNEMCFGDLENPDKSSLNAINQASERGWPVHRILTFWFDYYLASWSKSGQESCRLYKPNPVKAKTMTNFQRKDYYKPETAHKFETHFVKNYSDSTLKILARHDKVKIIDAKNSFNMAIKDKVTHYGLGTGNGVAMAAIAMVNYLEGYGYKLPYSFGGHNFKARAASQKYWEVNFHGVRNDWGVPVKNIGPGARDLPYDQMIPKGLDCVGFTVWALHNGGVEKVPYHATLYANPDLALKYKENEGRVNVAMPGDIIYRPFNGTTVHSKLVMGVVFDYNDVMVGYQVVEAVGVGEGIQTTERGIVYGGKLKGQLIHTGGSSENDPEVIGYDYTETEPDPNEYAVLDHSFCYEQRGPHKDLCTLLNPEDYFKGVFK